MKRSAGIAEGGVAGAAGGLVFGATMGVFAPLVGIVGSLQAAEALKVVTGIGRTLVGRLQMLDARAMEWTELGLVRDSACPVCADRSAGAERQGHALASAA